jgi:hypothetical protein
MPCGRRRHSTYFNIFVSANYCNITKLVVKETIMNGNIYKYLDLTTNFLQEFY